MSTAASRCSRALAVVLVLVVACGRDDGDAPLRKPPADPTLDTGAETTVVMTTTPAESTGTTGGGAGEPCDGDECAAPLVCRAPAQPTPSPMPGAYVCGECVGLDQAAFWCLSDASCCDPAHVCDNGLCHPPGTATTATGSSSESGTGGSTSGESSTGSESSTSDTSSSSSSGDDGSSTSGSTGA